ARVDREPTELYLILDEEVEVGLRCEARAVEVRTCYAVDPPAWHFRCRKDVDSRASRRLTAVSGRERRPRDLIDERVLRVVILEAVLHRVRLEDVRRLDLVLFVQALVASLVHAADSARDDVGRDGLVRIAPRVDRRQLTDLVERAREAGLDQKAGAEQTAVPYGLLMAAVIQR